MKSIIAREPEQKEFELLPAGNYVARCYSMIQLGTHKSEYQGKKTIRERVRITWELPTELREDGKPFVTGEEYTLSMAEMGNLRPMLESWRGKAFEPAEATAFDITNVLQVPCLLNIIHKPSKDGKKTYANISSISPLPKGMECPSQINETVIFTTNDFTDLKEMEKLPEFIQKKIKESMEFKGEKEEEIPVIQLDEDEVKIENVPF